MEKRSFGIIFDCDGTLADSLGLGMGSYNFALEMIGELPREPDEIKKFFGSGADRIFSKLLRDEKKAMEAFKYYLEHEERNVSKIRLHNGILDLLEKLRDANIPMGVVTGRHFHDLDFIFKHHSLTHYFQSIVCDNHLTNSKPAPEGILLAASMMSLTPQQTFYVGDSILDLRAARAAGSSGIAALWDGWSSQDEMEKEDPAFAANSPDMIWNYLINKSYIHNL